MTEPVDLAARVRPADGVLFREVDKETVLVHLERGVYYGLDEVGTRIWGWIAVHGRLDAVLSEVLAAYEVDEATARADLERLAGELVAQGLLTVEPTDPA